MNYLVSLDGRTVNLADCEWVLWEACGCPRGVTRAGLGLAATEDDAWKEFFPRKTDRARAARGGLRMELMTHTRYVAEVSPKFRQTCPHQPEALF